MDGFWVLGFEMMLGRLIRRTMMILLQYSRTWVRKARKVWRIGKRYFSSRDE